MNDTETISLKIRQFIAEKEKLSIDDVQNDLNLEESGLDSFARVELVLDIEQMYDIEFSDSESANISTVNDFVNLIAEKLAG